MSGGLDEYEIHRLLHDEGAPIDAFGVGSSLAVSPDAPTLDTVYKLVAFDSRPVLKTSPGKVTWPGAKQVWRAADWSGDLVTLADEPPPGVDHRPLLVEAMRDGTRTPAGRRTLDDAHHHFASAWADLPERLRRLTNPTSHPVEISPKLQRLAADLGVHPTLES